MYKHPSVRLEGNLSKLEWLKRKQEILGPDRWGGDLEIRLLAIGLHRNIVVITALSDDSTFARRYPSQPPPVEKMKGGVHQVQSSCVMNGHVGNLPLSCCFLMAIIIMTRLSVHNPAYVVTCT